MHVIWRIIVILGAVAAMLSPGLSLFAQGMSGPKSSAVATPHEGVLLLKNGQVLTGRITWSGDHYFVDRDGLQMGVRAAEVLASAADMDDAYRQQRDAIAKRDLTGHQELAQWCLRHGLLEHASSELATCEAIQSGNARTTMLAKQLQSVIRSAEHKQAASDPAAVGDGDVPAKSAPTVSGKEPPASQNNVDAAPALPAAAMETFVTTIQPLLINQCGNGGCHGGTTRAQFKLQRFDARRTPSRVYTDRNLAAVMKFIDRSNPDASPLVVAPSQPHGPNKTAIFEGRKLVHQAELTAWVRNAAGTPANSAKHSPAGSHAAGAAKKPGENSVDSKAMRAYSRSANARINGQDTTLGNAESDAGPVVNPHDPDVFNRRFFPNGRGTPAGSNSFDEAGEASSEPRVMPSVDRGSPTEPLPRHATPSQLPRRRELPPAPEARSVSEDEIPAFERLEER
jgi:hypothetical protein